MNKPTHSVILKGISFPVFVDEMTANYDGDCTAAIIAEATADGWIALPDDEAVSVKATYLDSNRNLRMRRRLANGQEYSATIYLLSADGRELEWNEEAGKYLPATV